MSDPTELTSKFREHADAGSSERTQPASAQEGFASIQNALCARFCATLKLIMRDIYEIDTMSAYAVMAITPGGAENPKPLPEADMYLKLCMPTSNAGASSHSNEQTRLFEKFLKDLEPLIEDSVIVSHRDPGTHVFHLVFNAEDMAETLELLLLNKFGYRRQNGPINNSLTEIEHFLDRAFHGPGHPASARDSVGEGEYVPAHKLH